MADQVTYELKFYISNLTISSPDLRAQIGYGFQLMILKMYYEEIFKILFKKILITRLYSVLRKHP
jgi:hypothetical protein